MIVSVSDFNSFLKKILSEELLSIQEIIIPSDSRYSSSSNNLFFRPLNKDDKTIPLGSYRTVDPVKLLFYLPRETVLPAGYKLKKRIVAGLKACDINALSLLDTALNKSGFTDPSYKHWRDNSIIISSDCTKPHSNCFCTFIGEKPFAENGFDLNISEINDQYFITVGSFKGEELLEMMKKHVVVYDNSQSLIEEVKARRLETINKLNLRIQTSLKASEERYSEYSSTEKNKNELWIESSKSCIGCGSCTNICPSCYCLILNDESTGKEFVKVRTYDSCQLNGYARVAGGGTPRPKAYQRFRNRLMCKFSYMKSNFGSVGCTGCGRCMDVCALGFDFVMLAKHVLQSQNISEGVT